MINLGLLKTILSIIFLVGFWNDQETEWVTIETEIYVDDDVSINEAEQELLNLTRDQAVAKVSGIEVRSISVLTESEVKGEESRFHEHFQQLMAQETTGMILQEEKEIERVFEDDNIILQINYRAEVADTESGQSTGYNIDITPNRNSFEVGDEI